MTPKDFENCCSGFSPSRRAINAGRPSKTRNSAFRWNYPRESDYTTSLTRSAMFGKKRMSSSERLPERSCRHSSGWCGIVEMVPLSFQVMFSCAKSSLRKKKSGSCKECKQNRGSEVFDRRFNSPIDVRPDFFDIQLRGTSGHKTLVVGDVEEIDLQVQVDRWSLPQLENFAIIAEQEFLQKKIFAR